MTPRSKSYTLALLYTALGPRLWARVGAVVVMAAVLLGSVLLGASAAAAQSAEDVEGRRHLNVSVSVPIVFDAAGDTDPGAGIKLTARVGYQIDILVVEAHAGFQQWGMRDPASASRSRHANYGPFVGFGGRLRFAINDVWVPYVMAGLRLSWWTYRGDSFRFSPTLVSQAGVEVHVGASKDWMIHAGLDIDVYMPGRAFENRFWSLGPYAGVGLRF